MIKTTIGRKILAFVLGVDTVNIYKNIESAIEKYTKNYNITKSKAKSNAELTEQLKGKNILIIPRQTYENASSLSNISSAIKEFVNNGGTAILCNSSSKDSYSLSITNLFTGTAYDAYPPVSVLDTTHPITNLLNKTFPLSNYIIGYSFKDSNIVSLVKSYIYDIVAYRQIGKGKAIIIGFDYYQNNDDFARIISNAINWSSKSERPSWQNLSFISETISSGDSTIFNVILSSKGVINGNYYENLTINTNDSANPLINIPCNLTVIGKSNINVNKDSINFGNISIENPIYDSIMITNTGCKVLSINNIIPSSYAFYIEKTKFTIQPYDTQYVKIYFYPDSIKQYSGYITIYNNDSNIVININGNCTPAPIYSLNSTYIEAEVNICNDSTSFPFYIYNRGLGYLTFEIKQIISYNSKFGEETKLNLWAQNGSLLKGVINPNDSIQIIKTFYADNLDSGEYLSYLLIETNDLNNPLDSIVCKLNVTGKPTICFSNNKIDFSKTIVGKNDIDTLYIYNSGCANLLISIISSSSPVFSIVNIQKKKISPRDSAYVIIKFAPDSIKNFAGFITIQSNLNDTSIELLGVSEGTPNLLSNPLNITSSIDSCSKMDTILITIYNNGLGRLVYNTNTSTNYPSWLKIEKNIYDTLEIGDSSIIKVVVNSEKMEYGTYNSNIALNTNIPSKSIIYIPCSLSVTTKPYYSLKLSIDFNNIMLGTTAIDTVKITNNSCVKINISKINSSISNVTIQPQTLNIASAQTGFFIVKFSPDSVKSYLGSITVKSNIEDKIINLNGTVIGAPNIKVNPISIITSISSCNGDSVVFPISIFNYGKSQLYWDIKNDIPKENLIYYDKFDSKINSKLWAYTSGAVNSSCGYYNSYYSLYFNTNIGTERIAETNSLNTSLGGVIDFYIKIAYNTTSPCEGADFGEDVVLEYSLDNGKIWTNLGTYIVGNYNNFTKVTIQIPKEAKNNNVKFRWRQIAFSDIDYDNWALDNVYFYITPNVYASDNSGIINENDSSVIYLKINSDNLNAGTYSSKFIINSNDPLKPTITIPYTFNIIKSPCADFDLKTYECNGDVNLTNTSINGPTSYKWSFGDGQTSSLNNPKHTYSSSGFYNIKLIVCNSNGCDSIVKTINIKDTKGVRAPECIPNAIQYSTSNILNVSFNTINNTSSNNNNYNDYSCSISSTIIINSAYELNVTSNVSSHILAWIDFNNDASFSNEELIMSINEGTNHKTIVNIPENAVKNTPLRLRILSEYYLNSVPTSCFAQQGEVEDYSIIIKEQEIAPVANFQKATIDNCKGIIQFVDKSSNQPNSWKWNFGDGFKDTIQNPLHTYDSSGTYNVILICSNQYGIDTSANTITIENFSPKIIINDSLFENKIITFSFANSFNANNWEWFFGDGYFSNLLEPIHSYSKFGNYTISLYVANNLCETTVYRNIYIEKSTAINQLQLNNMDFVLYPNPTSDKLYFKTNYKQNLTGIEIIDVIGRQVKTINSLSPNDNINLKGMESGTYYFKAIIENTVINTMFNYINK